MDTEPSQPTPPNPAGNTPGQSPDGPTYIGNTNIVDRSSLPQTPPVPVAPPAPLSVPNIDESYNHAASSAFSEAKVLLCGAASATSYLLVTYTVKNLWVTGIVSAVLAFAAILFAVSAYRRDGKLSPLTVVGLSAATITLVFIANILITEAFLHGISSGYAF